MQYNETKKCGCLKRRVKPHEMGTHKRPTRISEHINKPH